MTYYTITKNGKPWGKPFESMVEACIAFSFLDLELLKSDHYDIQPVEG